MNLILLLHQYNPYLIMATGTIAGIWGLILFFMRRSPAKPWRISLILTVVLGLLQGILGLLLVFLGHKSPHDPLHYMYGAIVIFVLPLAWLSFTTEGKNPRKDILVFSLAALILVAAAVRGLMTGAA